MTGMEILDKLLPYIAAAGVALVGGIGVLWRTMRTDQQEMVASLRAEIEALRVQLEAHRVRLDECERDREELRREVIDLTQKVQSCEIKINGTT